MRGLPPQPELVIGDAYRDVDGSLVHLLAIHDDICCWASLACASDEKQMSHRANFVRRFVAVRPVANRERTRRANRALPQAVVRAADAA